MDYARRQSTARARRHRFTCNQVAIDPYAERNTNNLWDSGTCSLWMDHNLEESMRSIVLDMMDYDWEGDQPVVRPTSQTVVYEMHVGGLPPGTRARGSRTRARSAESSRQFLY